MNKDERIKELEEQLTELQNENLYLAEETEQALHIRIIAEKLALCTSEITMAQVLVESVVTYNSLSYAAFYQITNKSKSLELNCYYALDANLKSGTEFIEIDEVLMGKLETLDGYFDVTNKNTGLQPFLPADQTYYDTYLVPVYRGDFLKGVIFVANQDKKADQYRNHLNSVVTPAQLMEHQFVHFYQTELLQKNISEKTNELSKTLQKLKLHIQQTPLGVIEWDVNFKVVAWNPAAEKIFGFSSEEAIGKHPTEIILPENIREVVDEIWQSLLVNKGGESSHNVNLTKEGKVVDCEWYNTPLIDEEGVVIGVASLVQDVTQRIQQEHELIMAKEVADKANKAKSEFLANMSHELRTPMHGILGYSEFGISKIDTVDKEKLKSFFTQINISGQRLLLLLNDLLDFSKLESGAMEMEIDLANMHDIVESCINEQTPRLKPLNISISNNCPKDLIVQCDGICIGQVITNLFSNAIKFSPENGVISFNYSETTISKGTDIENKKAIKFEVRDEGNGIPEDSLEEIFEKFAQSSVKNKHEGTGLGLAISREIIKAHKGKIWAENIPGSGANLTFIIPTISEV